MGQEGKIRCADLRIDLLTSTKIYIRTKGKELSGNYNHLLLSEMFHIQSRLWHDIASDPGGRLQSDSGIC
jgi:hypothetical protein